MEIYIVITMMEIYVLAMIVNAVKTRELTPMKKIMGMIYLTKTKQNMIEKLMTLLVGILLALAGWSLTRTFELSTQQAVLLNQVDQLEFSMQMLEEKMNKMMDSDEEIMEQHELLFKKLEQGNTGYSYN